MKDSEKPYSLAFALTFMILFFILASSTALAASSTITEARVITESTHGIYNLAVYGERVMWTDFLNDFSSQCIYVYDLSTSQEKRITINQAESHPSIYGDRIVRADAHRAGWNIYMYNLSTSQETHITAITTRQNPVIYGDRIVYLDENLLGIIYDVFCGDGIAYADVNLRGAIYDFFAGNFLLGAIHEVIACQFFDSNAPFLGYSNVNSDIYLYNLSTSKETQITTDNSIKGKIAIYGNWIVWVHSPHGYEKGDLYMYDLSTNKETRITTSGSAGDPAIYGDKIVWEDDRKVDLNGQVFPNIYMYDLSTHNETRITSSGGARSPAIYGDRIVWVDSRNGNNDIYLYNLSTSVETQVTTDVSDQFNPAIYGDTIVWVDNLYEKQSIYMCTLSSKS